MPDITHAFTSPKSDGADATLVQPSNWNATHYETIPAGDASVKVDHMALTTRLIASGDGRLTIREPLLPLKGSYAIGSIQITNDTYVLQYKRAQLNATARVTLSGNADLFIFDLAPVGRLTLAGRGA